MDDLDPTAPGGITQRNTLTVKQPNAYQRGGTEEQPQNRSIFGVG
jgi:hypothetical protein